MQMTKILSILLAFCFLMSVTATAVSAAPGDNYGKDKGQNWDNKSVTSAAVSADQGARPEKTVKPGSENIVKPGSENIVKPGP